MSFLDDFMSASEPEKKDFDLLPVGEYEASIFDCQLDLTKTPAKLSVTYKINGGEFKNRRLWANYQMAGQGLGFLKKDMKTLGVDYSNVQSEKDIAALMFEQIGRLVEIFVNQKEWQGKTYNNAYLNRTLNKPISEELPF